jgi:ABC-type glutathione transport system ATPase component
MTRFPFVWHPLSSQAASSIEYSSKSQHTPTVVQARNLIKRYQNLTAVKGISFEIFQGECFGLLGPNGAGKTSTIKMINAPRQSPMESFGLTAKMFAATSGPLNRPLGWCPRLIVWIWT